MELDIIKSQTTWNEASGSINSNFSKVRQAIIALQEAEGGGGIDEGQLEEYLTSHEYVTQSWVSGALNSYDSAIKQWVNDQGFITSVGGGDIDLSDYAKKADLEALTTRFDAVFDGREDQDVYINKWHELVAFLDGIEEGDSLANTLVNQDDRLLALEDMFAWEYDSEGNRTAIRAKSHFFSTGQVAAGGIGEESGGGGGGGISLLFDSTKTWADYTSDMADYALAAYHGKALNDRLVKVEGKATDVSFTQTLLTGKPIGTIMVDGVSQTMYAPSSYSADDIVPTQERNFVSLQDIEYWNTAYLPKTGGTLSGTGEYILEIKRTNGTSAYIKFTTFRGNNGYLGFGSDGKPTYLTYDGTANELYHKGNLDISNYLPLSGGTLSARLTIAAGSDKKIVLNNTDNDNKYQFISFQQNGTEYGQLGTAGSDDLMWGKEGYEKIILHSGNIGSYKAGSATKLEGLYHGSSDASNNPSFFVKENGKSKYYIQAYAGVLHIGPNLNGIIVNSSSNVTIGGADMAGGDGITPKLYISGNTRLAGSLYFTDGAYISYTNIHLPSNDGSNSFNIYGSGSLMLASFYSNGKTILGRQGNVGIGTASPAYKLDVHGSSRLAWDGSANSAIANATNFALDTTTTGGWNRTFRITNNGTTMFAFGAFGSGSSLTYGYVGGTYANPWVSFDSEKVQFNKNIRIGNAILSWDSANNALKIEGNVYSTGQVASGGIGTAVATIASDHEDRIAQLEAKVESLMS